jgi:hypothetical protein
MGAAIQVMAKAVCVKIFIHGIVKDLVSVALIKRLFVMKSHF